MSVARRGRLSEADPVNCWLAASFRIWGGCGSALPALQMQMPSAAIALPDQPPLSASEAAANLLHFVLFPSNFITLTRFLAVIIEP